MNIKWEVEYYSSPTGKKPAKDFIENLPVKLRAKVFRDIELLEEFGTGLTMPHSKFLKNGIYELRVRLGNDKSRILYFFFSERAIFLTNGFIKKTQPSELEKALKYKADYERRFLK